MNYWDDFGYGDCLVGYFKLRGEKRCINVFNCLKYVKQRDFGL